MISESTENNLAGGALKGNVREIVGDEFAHELPYALAMVAGSDPIHALLQPRQRVGYSDGAAANIEENRVILRVANANHFGDVQAKIREGGAQARGLVRA